MPRQPKYSKFSKSSTGIPSRIKIQMYLSLFLLTGSLMLGECAWFSGALSTQLRGAFFSASSTSVLRSEGTTLVCKEADRPARAALEINPFDALTDTIALDPTFTPTARPSTPTYLFNYSTGYLRADYTDVTTKPNVFVQAVVQVIGVCYQNRATNPPYRKLTKIVVDRASNTVTSSYADFTSPQCTGNPTYRFTEVDRFSSSVVTRNNVRVSVKLSYTTSAEQAVQVYPANSAGFKISYYGADELCSGAAHRMLVASTRCASYPDFFGQVQCKPDKENLTFRQYVYNATNTCAGSSNMIRKQKFGCSNVDTEGGDDFQVAECIV